MAKKITRAMEAVVRDPATHSYTVDIKNMTLEIGADLHNRLVQSILEDFVEGAMADIQWRDSEEDELVIDVSFPGLESVKFSLGSTLNDYEPETPAKRDSFIHMLEAVIRRLRAFDEEWFDR